MSSDLLGIELDDFYTVVKEIKNSKHEKTQIVEHSNERYIRKYIHHRGASKTLWSLYSDIDCEYLPEVYTWYTVGEDIAVVLEYIEGMSLEEYVLQTGPLTEQRALQIASNISEALIALHTCADMPIIHRDVNPANIIITDQDKALLIDLGISRVYKKDQKCDTEILGTIGYTAPEQFGYLQSKVQSDLYSLAAVILFMLSAKRPSQHAVNDLDDLQISSRLKMQLKKALAFNPEFRHASILEFKHEIDQLLEYQDDTSGAFAKSESKNDFYPSAVISDNLNVSVQRNILLQLKDNVILKYIWKAIKALAFSVALAFTIYGIYDVQQILHKGLSLEDTIWQIVLDVYLIIFFVDLPIILICNLFNIWSIKPLREHTAIKIILGYIVLIVFVTIIFTSIGLILGVQM